MRTLVISLTVLAIVGAAVGVYFTQTSKPPVKSEPEFKDAKPFVLKDAQGKTHQLSDFKGKAVIVHFWASWCPPCLDEIPQWLEAAKKFEGKPIQWIAISLDESWEDAHKILPESSLPKNVVSLLDIEKKVPDEYGSFQFPETYMLTKDHRVATKWVGAQLWTGEQMQMVITAVMERF
jgi:thiol-disulfide isomerase/thioredoxin